jgi:hypothetical protein
MEKPLEVLHYLYLPSQDFANRVAETLELKATRPIHNWQLMPPRTRRILGSFSLESNAL